MVKTKSDSQREAVEEAKEKIADIIASCMILINIETLKLSFIMPPQILNEEELKKYGLSPLDL